ncbi:MAG: tetratricopeptide repeat protein [Paludibacter sp.]
MKKISIYSIFTVLLISLLTVGCSTKKNTWLSRYSQAVNTRYNVYFNGYNSFNEGLKNIQKANKEEYSSVLPMYPISHHSNGTSAASSMDQTIEKCRKAIKLHSIKVKPDKDYKKANDPEYKLWYNQQEFNPAMSEAWILLAKAEFHKADFLGSVGTFSYIIRHYTNDKGIEATCQLWITRAYGEMGWIYEAEQMLSKVNQNNLKGANTTLFASVNADLLLKKHQFKEAIPFLELALSREKDNVLKQRFGYILAQLYHITGDDKTAYDDYTKVIKSNPPYEMDFNARISRAQLNQGNVLTIRKELNAMLRNKSNKEYLDQLYYALGNTYLVRGDTAKALVNFKLSAEKSTRKGIDKAVTLITLGDLYYNKRNYVLAQPCYEEAGKIITNEQDDYARVTRRGEMLSELVTQNDIVVIQDSLQQLALLPETKRIEVVNKIIEKLIADEKENAEKAQKEKQVANFNLEDEMSMPPIGMNPGSVGDWYFYNPDVMRKGLTEFVKKWGTRKLEDNWRRTNKATSLFAEESPQNKVAKDSTDTISKSKEAVMDNKKPEFYLRQIPLTVAQKAKSTAAIGDALFSMGLIYKDKVNDIPLAISTFKEFIRRFQNDERVADAYFNIYLMQTHEGNQSEANLYREKLISEFPNSKYKKILAQKDYTQRLERMYREQDSIYNLTYKAYNESDFGTVYKHVAYIRQNFPLSTLMPKFLFLNALSIGKKETPEKFKVALDSLVLTYPQSDVSAMAKDIMALIKQGQEAKTGTSSGSLLAKRDETTKEEINEIAPQQFSAEKQTKHRLLLISSSDKATLNKLQYNIASFNFSRFMIKDFDLVISRLDSTQSMLSVTNFESFDEVEWYLNTMKNDVAITKLMADCQAKTIIISEENFGMLKAGLTLKDYQVFLTKPTPVVVKKEPVAQAEIKPLKKTEPAPALKETPKTEPVKQAVTETKKAEKITPKPIEKPIEKSTEKPVEKTVSVIKPADTKPTQTTTNVAKKDTLLKQTKPVQPATSTPQPVVVQPKQPEVPLFKGLYGYKADEPHFIAIYVMSGSFDFAKVKADIDAYNTKNFAVMNLKVTLEKVDNLQVLIIGSLTNAQVAKSYLLRMVKEKSIFEGLKGSNYRNLIGSQKNLNTLIQQNALDTYFEFMQEYYLK